jgi:hypothetical protein
MITEFRCKMCDFIEEYESDDPAICPECGSKWYTLSFLKESRRESKFVSIGYKDSPRYSRTLGVFDEDLPAARKAHPQAEWKKFGNSWRPLIKNRTGKKRMMKQAKMQEYEH